MSSFEEINEASINDVTLFSNGIGHFRRIYHIKKSQNEKISIPFKRDHIGDVAASLQVFGKVKLNTPPSFTPSNANATALEIDQNNAFKSLVSSLSGASIKITSNNGNSKNCILLGLDKLSIIKDGLEISEDVVVVMDGVNVKNIKIDEIIDFEFLEDSIKTEISKALKNNFQQIKPDSTLLDLSLSSTVDQDTIATIQYTIPVAAWKMRYSIRQEDDVFILEIAAIIDNNTDEDWDNFRISVVTGNPISFSTDIANIVVPKRKFVNLVDDEVMGNVDIDNSTTCSFQNQDYTLKGEKKFLYSKNEDLANSNMASYSLGKSLTTSVLSPDIDVKDVGDFCVFTSSDPISILARKSAIVPMFSVELFKSKVVYFYKEKNHSSRPFRTIKFVNETQYSLGKGKTTIYNDGVFSGECVLEAIKPSEVKMLPHCLENGIKIFKTKNPVEDRCLSIKISDGVALDEKVFIGVTNYSIENMKNEKFQLVIDHENVLVDMPNVTIESTGVDIKEKVKLLDGTGFRIYIDLNPNQVLQFSIKEKSISTQKISITDKFSWIQQAIIDVKNPLAVNESIQSCVKIQQRIDELNLKLSNSNSDKSNLIEQSKRTRENVAAANSLNTNNSIVFSDWVSDLNRTENQIRSIEKEEIPMYKNKINDLQKELSKSLKIISVSWKE